MNCAATAGPELTGEEVQFVEYFGERGELVASQMLVEDLLTRAVLGAVDVVVGVFMQIVILHNPPASGFHADVAINKPPDLKDFGVTLTPRLEDFRDFQTSVT